MKKLVSLLLALTICLSVAGVAAAMYYSEEFMPVELTDYTWDSAFAVIDAYGFEGCTIKVKDCGISIWLPNELEDVPLTDEMIAEGFYAAYADWMEALAIEIVHYANINTTFDAFVSDLKANGMKRVTPTEINGMQFVIYRDPAYRDEITCRVASTVCEDGTVLEFVSYTNEDNYSLIRDCIFASIRN